MSRLDEIGERDGWRCWICDQTVDPQMSVNDARGPSLDGLVPDSKRSGNAKKSGKHGGGAPEVASERLAHRSCNTRKGAVAAIVPWADHLFVSDPAPILTSVDRLQRKSGREVMARCPTKADAEEAATWLLDRLSRLRPGFDVTTQVESIAGQHLLVLRG